MRKLKTKNIMGYKFRLKYVRPPFFTVIQLFIIESLSEVYFMVSFYGYFVHDSKLLYVSDN